MILNTLLNLRDMIRVEVEFHPGPFSGRKSYRLISIEESMYIHWTCFIWFHFYMQDSIFMYYLLLNTLLLNLWALRRYLKVEVEFHPGPFSQYYLDEATHAKYNRSIDLYSLAIVQNIYSIHGYYFCNILLMLAQALVKVEMKSIRRRVPSWTIFLILDEVI